MEEKRAAMNKRGAVWIVGLIVLIVIALSGTIFYTTSNSITGAVIGVQTISGNCNFTISSNVGNLGHDYSCNTTAFTVTTDNITIDCQNHVIACSLPNCENQSGMYFNLRNNVQIQNCRFRGWGYGVRLVNGTGVNLTLNYFDDNIYNVYIQNTSHTQSSQYHRIWNNNFTNYTNGGYDNGLNFWNLGKNCNFRNIIGGPCLGGNFWDTYTGRDTDGDGLGNSPYLITGSSAQQDELPLVDPWNNGTCPIFRDVSDTLPIDLNSIGGECFALIGSNMTLDCAGHALHGIGGGAGSDDRRGIEIVNINNVTVKNCFIHNFTYGIYVRNAQNITLYNNTIYDNNNTGIYIDTTSSYNISGNRIYNLNANTQDYGIRIVSGYPKENSIISDKYISNNVIYNNSLYGIYLRDNSDYITINNNSIYNNSQYGILINGSFAVGVNNNRIYRNLVRGVGIFDADGALRTINENTIYNNSQEGIYLNNTNNYQLKYNIIFNNTLSGIYFTGADGLTFNNNNLSFNRRGLAGASSSNINVGSSNNFFNNTQNGLSFTSISSSFIDESSFYKNGLDGLELNSSTTINITDNNIYNNSANGLRINNNNNLWIYTNTITFNSLNGTLLINSSNNTIYNNYFSNNTNNAYDDNNTNYWNVSLQQFFHPISGAVITNIIGGNWFGGNYWGNYTGSDLNGDGIGDLPANVTIHGANNLDNFPLTSNLASCGNISRSVTLVQNLTINGSCFIISGTNLVINFAGYYLTGNGSGTAIEFRNASNSSLMTAHVQNFSTAILLNSSARINLVNNSIFTSNIGVKLSLSNNSALTLNNLSSNALGMTLTDSWNASIYDNFFNNTLNVLEAANYNNSWNSSYNCTNHKNIIGGNCTGGNFWSDYLGRDNGRGAYPYNHSNDGIGDTNIPYTASGSLAVGDYLPLINNNGTQNLSCQQVSQDTTLAGDVSCLTGDGITITANNVVFDCHGYALMGGGLGSGIIVDSKSNVVIKNCNITNFYYGIEVLDSRNVQIINGNDLRQNGFYGIYLYQSNNTIIDNNTLISDNNGVYAINSRSTNITRNIINLQKKFYGIYLFNSEINTILNNTFTNNYHAFYVVNSSSITAQNNSFSNSDAYSVFLHKSTSNSDFRNNLISSGTEGLRIRQNSNNNIFVNNTVINHVSYGLDSTDSSGNTYTNNTFTNNSINVYLNASTSNTFTNNSISGSPIGMLIVTGSTSLTLTNNTINASTSPSLEIDDSNSATLRGNKILNNALLSASSSSTLSANNSIVNNLTIRRTSGVTISSNTLQYVIATNNSGLSMGSNNLIQLLASNCSICTIYSNIVKDQNLTALDLQKVTGSNIYSNNIQNTTTAILLSSSSNSNYLYTNWIKSNAVGINISSSTGNTLYNNYLENTRNVIDASSNTWYGNYSCSQPNIVGGPCKGGNFYSDYYGLDNGADGREQGDGIGDQPANYTIATGNYDSYPLVLYVARQYIAPTGSASAFTATSNTSGVLSGATSIVPNGVQTITYSSNSNNYLTITGLFNQSDVDARGLVINTASEKTGINKTAVTGITGIYQVYVYHNNVLSNGVYVCPNIVDTTSNTENCSNRINLTSIGNSNGWTLSQVSSYYLLSNLSNDSIVVALNTNFSTCGANIFHDITLTGDLSCNTSDAALTVTTDNITIDFNNYQLTGNGSGIGLNLTGRSNIAIKNAKIKGYSIGILVDPSLRINVTNSYFWNNSVGLSLIQTNDSLISSNRFWNNTFGLSSNLSFQNNYTGNYFFNNTLGVNFLSSNNSYFYSNWIANNTRGMNLTNSGNNTLYNNYFNNTNNAASNSSNRWNITTNCTSSTNIIGGSCMGGNFWSDYSGWDTDIDGVGETILPYNNSNAMVGGDMVPLTALGKISCGNVTINITLGRNLSLSGTCFNFTQVTDLIFNCNGYALIGSNSGIAFNLNDANRTTLRNCTLNDLSTAIRLTSSFNNTITANTIYNNTLGINLTNSRNNTIYNNYFNNTNNAVDNSSNKWNLTYSCSATTRNIISGNCTGGNFWSNYNGTDIANASSSTVPNISGDGIGDTNIPYNNSGSISNVGDYLPLLYVITTTTSSPPVDTTSSSGGGGGGGSSRSTTTNVSTVSISCTTSWQCGEWESCSNGKQIRSCLDINKCTEKKVQGTVDTVVSTARPSSSKDCVVPEQPYIPPQQPLTPIAEAPIVIVPQPTVPTTTLALSAAILVGIGGVLSYWQWGYAPSRLRRKLRKIDPLVNEESAAVLKEDYLGIYHLYLKLSERHKQNFYTRVTKLREKIEEQMVVEKKLEELFMHATDGDLKQQQQRYLKIYGLYQKLPNKIQGKYYPEVIELREKLERGTAV